MTGIILAKNLGGAAATDTAVCLGQSATAGALTLTINGSFASGGVVDFGGAAFKVKTHSSGNDSGKTLTVTGKFWASNAAGSGDYTTTIQIATGNATSATSSLYASRIESAVMSTITAGSIKVGFANDYVGVPVTLPYGSLWNIDKAGTWGGATLTLKKYVPGPNEWVSQGTATAASASENYELPAGSTVKADIATGSTTTALWAIANIIQKTK
jgi:hypothetical protein